MEFSLGSGPKFAGLFSSNAERIALDHISFRFWIPRLIRSGDIRDQSLRLYKIDRNFACFSPIFFLFLGGGEPLEFLDVHYKIQPGSDHVAKFHGDRPRELRNLALKKRKHHA